MRSKCIELTVVTAFEGYSIRLFHDTRHTFASRAIEKKYSCTCATKYFKPQKYQNNYEICSQYF